MSGINKDNTYVSDHLVELRRRLLWTLLFFVGALICSLTFSVDLFRIIKAYIFMGHTVFTRSPGDPLKVYMQISFISAFFFTLPIIMIQLWYFVRPGLRVHEQRAASLFIPLSVVLFLCGLSFGVFVIFPYLLHFLVELNTKMGLIQMYGVYDAFSFFLNIVFPLALLFELPAIVLFLTKIGIITPDFLQRGRRIAYFIMVILSAVIAPPDFISNILIAIPLILLYEASIGISLWMVKRDRKNEVGKLD